MGKFLVLSSENNFNSFHGMLIPIEPGPVSLIYANSYKIYRTIFYCDVICFTP